MGPTDPLPPTPPASSSHGQVTVALAVAVIAASLLFVQPGKDMITHYCKAWMKTFVQFSAFYPAYLPIAGLGAVGFLFTLVSAVVASGIALTWRYLIASNVGHAKFQADQAKLLRQARKEMRVNPNAGTVLVPGSMNYARPAHPTRGQIVHIPPSDTGHYALVDQHGVPTLESA